MDSVQASGKYGFAIDRGGTFTDVLCVCPDGRMRTMKLLSEDPQQYSDAPREGIRRILKMETGVDLGESGLVSTKHIGWIRMGTTVATNALLERKGEPMALLVNRGFRDLLHIGNQSRPDIFDLNIKRSTPLYSCVVEADCRLVPAQSQAQAPLEQRWRRLQGVGGTSYLEMRPVVDEEVRATLQTVRAKGISTLAIVLAHSYACPQHEQQIAAIACELGFLYVVMSHEAMPMCRLTARGQTACADAYLTPHVERYLNSFKSGFERNLTGVDVLFMQSDGGLTGMDTFKAARAILSGPAGGLVGYAVTGARETKQPLIGFDMGGTSTDVSRFDGHFEHVVESTTAGITIQAPQLDISTVAAGGGSRLFYRAGIFAVGPDSAGANPGPACYKKGGPLTVTDANLILGRIMPEYFPAIFGPNEDEPLDYAAAERLFRELQTQLVDQQLSIQEIAAGFIRVANEAMCRAIRAQTQSRGYDTAEHVLCCFGGAGGQHACSIARELGIKKVLIHKYAGILSAYGMALADIVHEAQEPCGLEYKAENMDYFKTRLTALAENCKATLQLERFTEIVFEPYLHLRYEGTDGALMCAPKAPEIATLQHSDFYDAFVSRYQSEFGFVLHNRRIIVEDIRLRAIGKNATPPEAEIEDAESESPTPCSTKLVYFEKRQLECPIYLTAALRNGHQISGPAIIIDNLSTIFIEPDCKVVVTACGNLVIHIEGDQRKHIGSQLDPIHLSVFSHRFMSIAEQMGRVLQRTAISTNIKERLDFSCALFGPDGGLVSNAPHIPVHLGAMQETVQYQLRTRGGSLKNGDVLLSNHPQAGGSHLPDLTVITPVFYKDVREPIFFVAARGHHADIGGITPGSMPPHSTTLAEEGCAFKSFLIVEGGKFQEAELTEKLTTSTGVNGAVGTRNLQDNISDLKAQIAANQRGIQLVSELIDCYGLNVVQAYMSYIQENAELAVRDMLKNVAAKTCKEKTAAVLTAEEFMDDGSPIRLKITIDTSTGAATFDYTNSGPEVWGNCNAPRSITLSAIIYCLRCMIGYDIPLNQGCLKPIKVIVPKNSILDPSDDAAVVGGNVLTSQRVVDTILKAFQACAASQGCMNNITLGTDSWGYYETVAGGAGAGPSWHGVSGVHTHMTNTRITDPEILELRYPIILMRFCLRSDESGGRGQYNGGEGVERHLLFRQGVVLSVLTERRALQPFGMAGGEPAKRGSNVIIRRDGRRIYLGSKACIRLEAGEIFAMKTPGGGGYGRPCADVQ